MRHVAALAAMLVLASPATAEPFQHASGEWRQYMRDWLAACPAQIIEDAPDYYGYSCFASTGSQVLNRAELPAFKLTLIRNRLDGDLDLAITIALDAGRYDETRPMRLLFGGDRPVMLYLGKQIETRVNTVNQYFVTDATMEADLIARLKDGASLKLIVPMTDADEPAEISLSLDGVMASLDFMETHARKVADY